MDNACQLFGHKIGVVPNVLDALTYLIASEWEIKDRKINTCITGLNNAEKNQRSHGSNTHTPLIHGM
jgi:hypothetical protein